jgi:hypothetical protein
MRTSGNFAEMGTPVPTIILDYRSFLVTSQVTREQIIPHPFGELLARLAMDYNVVCLMEPTPPKTLREKALSMLRRAEKAPQTPGRVVEAPVYAWGDYALEMGSPIFYMDEVSNGVLTTLPNYLRIRMPTDIRIVSTLMSSGAVFQGARDMGEMRKSFQNQQYRAHARDRFSSKF